MRNNLMKYHTKLEELALFAPNSRVQTKYWKTMEWIGGVISIWGDVQKDYFVPLPKHDIEELRTKFVISQIIHGSGVTI